LQPSNDRGFTLIEVLIAMVILVIALVAMAQLMAISLRMQQLGRNQTAATRLAQDKVDELMSQNFNVAQLSLGAGGAPGGSLTADVANHFDAPAGVPYRRRWLVEALPQDAPVAAGKLRRVTIRVTPASPDRSIAPAIDLVTIVRCWPC
jgi:prepilin-type N-terminal cleavage/methylation domain-containing protein